MESHLLSKGVIIVLNPFDIEELIVVGTALAVAEQGAYRHVILSPAGE